MKMQKWSSVQMGHAGPAQSSQMKKLSWFWLPLAPSLWISLLHSLLLSWSPGSGPSSPQRE